MSFQVRIFKDEVSPALSKLDASLKRLAPILEAVGLQVVSFTQRTFRDESLSAAAWPAKRDGSPSNLIQSGTLRRSIRITNIGASSVTVGTDRIYGAIHQFGGTIKPKDGKRHLVFSSGGVKYFVKQVTIPARPFFPVTQSGELTSAAQTKVAGVLEKAIRIHLR